MSSVIVLRQMRDADLAKATVLALLATEGVSAKVLTKPSEMANAILSEADLIVIVYSAPTAEQVDWIHQADAIAEESAPMAVHLVAQLSDDHAQGGLPATSNLIIDLDDWRQGRSTLRSLLPLHESISTAPTSHWTVEDFGIGLHEAVQDWDHPSATRLVEVAERQLPSAEDVAVDTAESTMKTLQNSRYFDLERRLGQAYEAVGVVSPQLRRRLGQALIETDELDNADAVLKKVFESLPADHREWAEAGGLLARSRKKRYFDVLVAGGDPRTQFLDEAIGRYAAIYDESNEHIWPGVNAISLRQRALRDRIDVGATVPDPTGWADRILRTIADREEASTLESWDYATAAEAHLAKGDVDEAIRWLDRYIPTANSFELGSTLRQFNEVVDVNRFGPKGQQLADNLEGALASRRGGTSLVPLADPEHSTTEKIPLLVHAAIDGWEPPDDRIRVTARMGRVISVLADETGLEHLIHDLTVRSIERSRPHTNTECHTSVPFVRATAIHNREGRSETGERAIVAIIDSGIDVRHQAFLGDDGATRIARIWHQYDQSGAPPAGFDHGSEYTAADINLFITGQTPLPPVFDQAQHHGTHVASICAGRATGGPGGFAGGIAPGATIVIVVPNSMGTSIGYSTSHLAALDYVDTVATELNMPVVVNVSLGQNAGAHDGKSPLEAAFNNFSSSGVRPGRVVVKSAGNERSANGHASLLLAPHSMAILPWEATGERVLPDHPDEIQVWCPYGNEYTFRLVSPSGEESEVVGTDRTDDEASFASKNNYRLAFTESHDTNGLARLSVEIGRGNAEQIEPGTWKLEIESGDVPGKGEIHAWIERDAARPISFTDHVNARMTLSIPGTAESVITVAAVSPSKPYKVAEFSSYGPTFGATYEKPDLAAPGVGIDAAASGSTTRVRADSGTSMAAPHVSGAVALALSAAELKGEELAANKIATILRASTQNYDGDWRPDQGYGVLDVEALLKMLKLA